MSPKSAAANEIDYDFSLGTFLSSNESNATAITCVYRGGLTERGLLKNEAGSDVGSTILYFDVTFCKIMPRWAAIDFHIFKTPATSSQSSHELLVRPLPDRTVSTTRGATSSGNPPPYTRQDDNDENCHEIIVRSDAVSPLKLRRPPMFSSIYNPYRIENRTGESSSTFDGYRLHNIGGGPLTTIQYVYDGTKWYYMHPVEQTYQVAIVAQHGTEDFTISVRVTILRSQHQWDFSAKNFLPQQLAFEPTIVEQRLESRFEAIKKRMYEQYDAKTGNLLD